MQVIAGIIGGIILGVIGDLLATLALAGHPEKAMYVGMPVFGAFFIIGFFVAIKSESGAKAWRKLLISAAILSFSLPISGIIFTGGMMASQPAVSGEFSAAHTAGVAMGGALVSGFLGFIGFFLGVIFLVIGLLVGRDKQVIYVQAPPDEKKI